MPFRERGYQRLVYEAAPLLQAKAIGEFGRRIDHFKKRYYGSYSARIETSQK